MASVNGTVSADPEKPVATGRTPGIGWPGAGDHETFRAIIAQLEEKGCKLDHSRLYAHGQSLGGRGVAGMVGTDPTLFAAAGTTTNGAIFEVPEGVDWETGSNNGLVKDADVIDEVATYTIYRWKNEAGMTVYECAVVHKRGHSMKADNCWKVWEEFSKYTRDENGNELIGGEPIYGAEAAAPAEGGAEEPAGKTEEAGETLKDGEYEGSGVGMEGGINVKVTIKDGKIVNVDVDHNETEEIGAAAQKQTRDLSP